MKTKTVNIAFQESLLRAIDRTAKAEARSRSELLREAARLYMEQKKRWENIFRYGERQAREKRLTLKDVEKEIARYRKKKR